MKTKNILMSAAALAVFPSAAQAAVVLPNVTYLDAAEGNTGPLAEIRNTTGVWDSNSASRKTGFWDKRDGATFGFNGDVLEAGDGTADNPGEISLTIGGLTPGSSYEITGYYTTIDTLNWETYMGLSSGVLSRYDNTNGTLLTSGDTAFTNSLAVSPATDGIRSYYVTLGTAMADPSGDISVFVNHAGLGDNTSERAWFDGAGYQAVPEPGSAILLALSGFAMSLRRRR